MGFGSVPLPPLPCKADPCKTDREVEILMPKAEWGVKRTCITCHARFYDLARDPIVCPKCGAELDITVLMKPKRAKPAAKAADMKVAAKDIDLIDDEVAIDDDVEIDGDDVDDDDDAEIVVLADEDADDDDDEVAVVAKGGEDDDLDGDVLLAVDDDDDDDLDDLDDVAPKKLKDT